PDLAFENMDLKYRDYSAGEVDYGINYEDIHLSSFSGTLKEIDFKNYIFKADVQNLAFKEKSGLVVKDLTAHAIINPNEMEFTGLNLELNNSHINDYVRFDYDSFNDFKNFISKVRVTGDLRNSRITSEDIAYFAPQV